MGQLHVGVEKVAASQGDERGLGLRLADVKRPTFEASQRGRNAAAP